MQVGLVLFSSLASLLVRGIRPVGEDQDNHFTGGDSLTPLLVVEPVRGRAKRVTTDALDTLASRHDHQIPRQTTMLRGYAEANWRPQRASLTDGTS